MTNRNLRGTVALGSLTATVALLAGLSNAGAQTPSSPYSGKASPSYPLMPSAATPATGGGAGSFPQSFLIPGTNTSLSVYGIVRAFATTNIGQHTGDTNATGITAFQYTSLGLEGPGVTGGSFTTQDQGINGGLRMTAKASTFSFETRTPSDYGEIKTVMSFDANLFSNQSNFIGTTTSTNSPSAGSGNTEAVRLLYAYGTIGPWLVGQTLTTWVDPRFIPEQGDTQWGPAFVGTSNNRQPMLRYTYLAGNGITISAAAESQESGTYYVTSTSAASMSSYVSNNLDAGGVGGIVNLPSFNVGATLDQPWGHLMGRVGVSRNEIRNTEATNIFTGSTAAGSNSNNIKKWGWAAETGAVFNTWGLDQLQLLVNYDKGIANYSSDLSPTSSGNMFCLGSIGQCNLISDFTFSVAYHHVFNPNWRMNAHFGMGFLGKPSAAGTLSGVATATASSILASLDKRHLASVLNVYYSPVPGITDISLEWGHYERVVQAAATSGRTNRVTMNLSVYW